jgi:hypothetical protein
MEGEAQATEMVLERHQLRLEKFAGPLEVTLIDLGNRTDRPDDAFYGLRSFQLMPTVENGCSVAVLVEDAWTIYVELDGEVWVEIFTNPQWSGMGLDDLFDVLDAAAGGQIERRTWTRKRDERVLAKMYSIQLRNGGRWRRIGDNTAPLPLIWRLFANRSRTQFEPWRARRQN